MDLFNFDNDYRIKHNIRYLAGIDEAGRGPLAGPVFAAAVILPPDFYINGINDSKKLSEKKRDELFDVIIKEALAYSICISDVSVIEEINILNATMLAMKNAAESLDIVPQRVLIDGNKTPDIAYPNEYLIKGDAKSQSVAAASILAKVSRDRFCMDVMANEFPQYLFEKHKGYGTKLHFEKIMEYGPCPYHRMSFLRKKLGEAK